MFIKQLSIFVENKHGRLEAIISSFADNGINLRALSLADTTDFGILRIIVDDPDNVVDMLAENSITASLTSVLSVPVNDNPGGLAEVLNVLAANDITVDYMYAYISHADDRAYVILRTEKENEAEAILEKNGFPIN